MSGVIAPLTLTGPEAISPVQPHIALCILAAEAPQGVAMSVVPAVQDAVIRVADAYARPPERPDLFGELSTALQQGVPFDASAWFATDPHSLLPSAPGRVENLPATGWTSYWEAEFNDQDVLLFRDLAHSRVTADSLLRATDRNPERSPRYRGTLTVAGFSDELRAVFRAGSVVWGVVSLLRGSSQPAFSPADCAVLQTAGPSIAAALRAQVARTRPVSLHSPGLGTALFSSTGTLVALDAGATAWFHEIERSHAGTPERRTGMATVDAVVAHANAVGNERARGPSFTRLRTQSGCWTVLSASPSRTPQGERGLTSLVIDRARPSQVAELLIEANCLTARERHIVQEIAHGYSNDEIGRRLGLSPNTVRDHLSSVFDKVRVTTRGELIALLFSEQVFLSSP